jgi:tetratricopeptide (TPR) repeat protein
VRDDPMTAAIGIYRAGELLLHDGKTTEAWTALWKVVTDFPDEPTAADALKDLLVDGRGRDARALAEQIAGLFPPLSRTQVADNLLWTLADLTEHELADPQGARVLYDRIPVEYPQSGLRDDARWHGARISRAIGDPKGAVERLKGLVATREVAIGAGSYFSIWLDDAQLELGKVLRDDLKDFPAAMAAFRKLPKDYPASILKDDALYELAITQDKAGDHAGACESLKKLVKQAPESKYLQRGDVVCP